MAPVNVPTAIMTKGQTSTRKITCTSIGRMNGQVRTNSQRKRPSEISGGRVSSANSRLAHDAVAARQRFLTRLVSRSRPKDR